MTTTLESFRQVAAGYIAGLTTDDPEVIAARREAVAIRAFETETCIIHAATLIANEHEPQQRCDLCGAPARQLPHHLCIARAERGLPTPSLEWRSPCYCARCDGAIPEAIAS